MNGNEVEKTLGNDDVELPKVLRYTMAFVDRVGFPIVAFLLMFYVCFVGIRDMTRALGQVTISLEKLGAAVASNTEKIANMNRR